MTVHWKYTLSEPVLGEEEINAVTDCIRSGWLSMGPKTKRFEGRFASAINADHALAVSNGTAALHIALAALDVGSEPGDEVIQPSINFVAAANMTKALGATPVFADILSPEEPTISPAEVAAKITPRTKAVVVMHFGGYAAQIRDIIEICAPRGIPVIEDACHAPAQTDPLTDRYLGSIGAIGCFSFFSNKNMTTAEGGMVATNHQELADKMRALRSHGMTTLSWDRHHGRPSTYDVTMHGYNYRTDDLRSALGLAQLDRLPEINRKRRRLAAAYAHAVSAQMGNRARYVFADRASDGTAHLAGIVIDPDIRDAVREALAERRIQTSLHYPPIHQFTAFAGSCPEGLPISESFAKCMITLPMHAYLDEAAVKDIVRTLSEIVDRHG